MLNLMRRFASTWAGKILGGLLLIGLAGFGISNVILDLGSSTLAKVGDEEITTQEFQRAYQQQLSAFARQTGQQPTNEQALQLGIPTAVISRLASDAAVDQFAKRQGIGVSDSRLADIVRKDPSFAGTLGTFERANFEQIVRQMGYTEAEYFDTQTRAARRQQVAIGLFAGTVPSAAALSLLNRYSNDTRTVEYFTLNETSLASIPTPTEEELKAYLAEHQADFRTEEARTADVVVLTPDILAEQNQPTEDEIKAEYERTKAQLVKIEKRDIKQVAMPSDATAKWFELQQANGVSFGDAVKISGLAVTDIGLLSKGEVNDAALADAAFGLAKEGDFAVIAGIGAKRVVAVTKIEAGGETSYDEAKPAITQTLALNKAKAAYADIQDQIEELRAAFKPLKEIADRFKLPIATVAVTAGGSELSAVAGLAEENRAKAATAIFAATEGKLSPTVAYGATNNLWFDLSKVDPARDKTLDEVRDAVTTAWTAAKTQAALVAEVQAILGELDGGKSFADVAAARNQFATISQAITRGGDKTSVLTAQVAEQIFSRGPDSHGSAIDRDGEYLVFHVVDVTPAATEPDAGIKDLMTNSNRDALYAEFIAGLRDEAGIKINQQALSQLLALDSTQ